MDNKLTKRELIFFIIGDILVTLFGIIVAIHVYLSGEMIHHGHLIWGYVMGMFGAINISDIVRNSKKLIRHDYEEKE